MTKINKKTRIKGLPAKLQLQEKDSVTGSYPTKLRQASDNRSGNSPLRFDDNVVQFFQPETVYYPSLLPIASPDISTELTSSITASATPRKGVEDQYIRFTVSGAQNLQPFRDNDLPEVDGKSSGNPFYATGSLRENAGLGLQQPLWAKSKIEIDISTDFKSTIGYRSGATDGGKDYAMMYYNPTARRYSPVGSGTRFDEYQDFLGSAVSFFINEKAIGFLPGLDLTVTDTNKRILHQTPTSVFGFPYDKKYFVDNTHPYSSSILIPASKYINSPFLLEKIVIEFSCSHHSRDFIANTGGGDTHAINTFFILNQKRHGKTKTSLFLSGSDPLGSALTLTETTDHNSGTMDVVTYNQFAFINDTKTNAENDPIESIFLNLTLSKEIKAIFTKDFLPGDTQFTFTGSIQISGTIKSPVQNSLKSFLFFKDLPFTYDPIEVPWGVTTNSTATIKNSGFVGGRNGISIIPNTRNSKRTLSGIEKGVTLSTSAMPFTVPKVLDVNPYLLHPSDQLIIGFECTYPLTEHSIMSNPFPFAPGPVYLGPELTINAGPAKIILYGSQIKEGKEYHDTLNQELTSNSTHEIIG